MLARIVVMIEVRLARVVTPADIDDRDLRIVELFVGRFAPHDRCAGVGDEKADGEQVVFVRAAGVGDDFLNHVGSLKETGILAIRVERHRARADFLAQGRARVRALVWN